MSETEKQKQSQDLLEQLSEKMKLLSEYQSKLNQAKTGLEKYQSLQHETTSEKLKSITKEQHQSENIQVEISDVKLLKPVSSLLHGYYLDRPKQGEIFHQHTIKLVGWVVSKNSPAVEVEIINNGQVVQTASIKKKRPDVAKVYPQVAHAKTSGFATEIQLISLPQESELTLQVILKDKSRVPFGSLKLHSKYHKSIGVIYEESKHLEAKKPHNKYSQVSNVPLDSEVEIISIHVPKTAGTTFRDLLIQVYGKEKVFNDYKKQPVSEVLLEIESQNIRAIHGHFKVQKYDDYFLEAKRIIWLREPIKRLISNYWHQITHFQNRKITQNEVELEKKNFLNWANRNELRNYQSSYFIEKNIEDFWFVGITEFLEEDLKELQIMLGWQQLEITYQNQHKYSKVYQYLVKTFLSDGELIEEIKFINSKDIKLYEMALTLREKRIKTKINRVSGGT
ncbi:MAG: sulfotransferase family protein, partial [Okeania sp. SIO1H6]|nr:sulfotransferase family protein [Okeania sp. SIO1H6]